MFWDRKTATTTSNNNNNNNWLHKFIIFKSDLFENIEITHFLFFVGPVQFGQFAKIPFCS